MNKKILCLRNINIYEGLSDEAIMESAKETKEVYFEKNNLFYDPENPSEKIYMIKEGEVELSQSQGGKKIVFERLGVGDIFGNFGLEGVNHQAKSIQKGYLCEIPMSDFLEITRKNPKIFLRLMRVLAEKINYYENKLGLVSSPAKKKVLEELRHLDQRNKRRILGRWFHIPLRISHARLAEMTGLNRVTVTKIMGELKKENLITLHEMTGAIELNESNSIESQKS